MATHWIEGNMQHSPVIWHECILQREDPDYKLGKNFLYNPVPELVSRARLSRRETIPEPLLQYQVQGETD